MNPSVHTPTVSIVVPVFNEQKHMHAFLNCLMRQSRLADTIYIIDNNCTDDSIRIAQQYPDVTIISESVQGICAAVYTGLDAAAKSGGILIRCDADCRPESDWIERIIDDFGKDEDVVAVTGPGKAYDTGPIRSRLIDATYMKPYFRSVGLALGNTPIFGSNFALKAETWRVIASSVHLKQHQDIHDDIDISYHIADKGRTYYDNDLVMPMSARPFNSLKGMIKRYVIGFRSIFLHWPEQAPWTRWMH